VELFLFALEVLGSDWGESLHVVCAASVGLWKMGVLCSDGGASDTPQDRWLPCRE